MAPSSRTQRLPVLGTVQAAYVETFRHLGGFIRIGWLWLLLLTALVAFTSWFLFPLHEQAASSGDIMFSPAQQATFLISFVAGSSIAVAWHRLMLVGEPPGNPAYLRLDAIVWRYLAAAGLMALPFLLPTMLVPVSIAGDEGAESPHAVAVNVLPFVVVGVGLYFTVKLGPVLPAIALQRSDVTLARVWRVTRGSWWRLLAGLVLTGAVPGLLAFMPLIVRDWHLDRSAPPTMSAFVRASLETELLSVLSSIFAISFLSFAFRHFFGSKRNAPGSR